jgi:hypothetical protein
MLPSIEHLDQRVVNAKPKTANERTLTFEHTQSIVYGRADEADRNLD